MRGERPHGHTAAGTRTRALSLRRPRSRPPRLPPCSSRTGCHASARRRPTSWATALASTTAATTRVPCRSGTPHTHTHPAEGRHPPPPALARAQGSAHLQEDLRTPPFLCPVDLRKLLAVTGGAAVPRYEALLAFCEAGGRPRVETWAAFAAWLRERLAGLRSADAPLLKGAGGETT